MNEVKLGSLISASQVRDAIHIAVAPVIAGADLRVGQGVAFAGGDTETVVPSDNPLGVVDPFLKSAVKKGQRFYMLLNPYTITSLRHEWTHPAFGPLKQAPSASEKWMREWAMEHVSYDYYGDSESVGEEAAYQFAIHAGHTENVGPYESARDHIDNEWWAHWENITGAKGNRGAYFSCAC